VKNYTLIWMDSLRNGEFGLSNTNKLIRFYPGATGMKTGFTDSAGYCMSATAQRDGMELISVVMKADTSDNRFSDAKKLLDYGFANFTVYEIAEQKLPPLKVKGGVCDSVNLKYEKGAILLTKGRDKLVESQITLPEYIKAPVDEGQVVGQISYSLCGEEIAVVDIKTLNGVQKISFSGILKKLIGTSCMIR
jgi:D-alanyl-D-alanine carboxypeptidase (penicillin-binding protein 5/6)